MLIGFTHNTGKILPRIFCRKFRHCAIILEQKDIKYKYIMLQVGFGRVNFIPLQKRDLKILEQNGWVFLQQKCYLNNYKLSPTCVSFAKRALGIRAPFVLTPYQLFKYLKKCRAKRDNISNV